MSSENKNIIENAGMYVYNILGDNFRSIPDKYIAFCLFILTGIILFIVIGFVLPSDGALFLGFLGIFGVAIIIYAVYIGTLTQQTVMNSTTLFAVCISVFFMFGLFTLALLYISSQDYSKLYPNLSVALLLFLMGTCLFGMLAYLFHMRDEELLANFDIETIIGDSDTKKSSKSKSSKSKKSKKNHKGGDSETYKFATWL
jgi:hypothetical protein